MDKKYYADVEFPKRQTAGSKDNFTGAIYAAVSPEADYFTVISTVGIRGSVGIALSRRGIYRPDKCRDA